MALACVCVGCRPSESERAQATSAIEPWVEPFLQYERWVRRALVAERLRDGEGLRELIVAPMRRDSSVVGVLVERSGVAPTRVVHPSDFRPPEETRWVELRHSRLGEVRVATPQPGPDALCIISKTSAMGGGELRVVVAYRQADDGPK